MNQTISIPIVDISNDIHRQFIVDRESGVYLGHPTTALLDDGKTILCVYPKSHAVGQIVLKKSNDGGKTWSKRLPVPSSFSTSMECPTIYKTYDEEGKRRLLLFSGLYPIRLSVSEDDGESFSELTPIGNFGGIVAISTMICTGPGKYTAFFHDDGDYFSGTGAAHKMELYKTGEGSECRTKLTHSYSKDNGLTWSEPLFNEKQTKITPQDDWIKIHELITDMKEPKQFTIYAIDTADGGITWSSPRIVIQVKEMQLCEPCAIFSPDQKRLALLFRENSRKFNSMISFSEDNGNTWSIPRQLPNELTGDRHYAHYLPDGRLFISFRDMAKGSPTYGSWVGWIGTFQDIEEGHKGQYRILIMKNYDGEDCAYPAIVILPDETIVTTTYGHFSPGESPYVVTVRFHINELDSLANSVQSFRV